MKVTRVKSKKCGLLFLDFLGYQSYLLTRIRHCSRKLMIMQGKYCEEMKEAENLSFGEKVSLPPV